MIQMAWAGRIVPETKEEPDMKKIIIMLLMAGIMLFGLAGCTEGTAPQTGSGQVFDAHKEGAEPEYVTFGHYPKNTPIEWIVLDEKDGARLLLSRYNLGFMAYKEKDESVTWETSDVRKWMNGTFYRKAFSGSEKALIRTVTLENEDGPNGTEGGNDTKDRVFALSLSEVHQYFDLLDPDTGEVIMNEDKGEPAINREALKTVCLQEARPDFQYEGDTVPGVVKDPDIFFLRTPGTYDRGVCIVWTDGNCLGAEGAIVQHGVRPAIWVTQ